MRDIVIPHVTIDSPHSIPTGERDGEKESNNGACFKVGIFRYVARFLDNLSGLLRCSTFCVSSHPVLRFLQKIEKQEGANHVTIVSVSLSLEIYFQIAPALARAEAQLSNKAHPGPPLRAIETQRSCFAV